MLWTEHKRRKYNNWTDVQIPHRKWNIFFSFWIQINAFAKTTTVWRNTCHLLNEQCSHCSVNFYGTKMCAKRLISISPVKKRISLVLLYSGSIHFFFLFNCAHLRTLTPIEWIWSLWKKFVSIALACCSHTHWSWCTKFGFYSYIFWLFQLLCRYPFVATRVLLKNRFMNGLLFSVRCAFCKAQFMCILRS